MIIVTVIEKINRYIICHTEFKMYIYFLFYQFYIVYGYIQIF